MSLKYFRKQSVPLDQKKTDIHKNYYHFHQNSFSISPNINSSKNAINTTVSSQRWCKLRGNLLFYFKSNDQFSEPAGVIVLEKYRVTVPNEPSETFEGFPFYIGE